MSIEERPYSHRMDDPVWQAYWEKEDIYRWDSTRPRDETFVIDTPPPTVSGLLHMGHVFSYTQADFIARYQRMRGKTVFYPMGFDDNGLPTERLVEKMKNVRASSMDREAFIGLCHDVVQEAEEEFRRLFRSIALSVDWTQEYQTISKRSRTLSQLSFIDLYRKSKAYRNLEPTLWDPADQTALAQADIEDKEKEGAMHRVLFADEQGVSFPIMTTRPEYLPACVAVMCHPEDARYQPLHGTFMVTPLFGARVPVIPDSSVEPDKGTGLVMCCTFGDLQDCYWWKTHRLPLRNLMTKQGRFSGIEGIGEPGWESVTPDQAKAYGAQLEGKTVAAAKALVVEWLREAGRMTAIEPITRPVKCAERSGHPIEIIVTDQWFIRTMDCKTEVLEKAKQCEWHPPYMRTRLEHWVEGLNWDWCISRQRFFGVPFPVWYSKRAGEEGKILVAAPDQLPVDPLVDLPHGYERHEIEADRDVMDTWATSAVSPQLNSFGITDDLAIDLERHRALFPADLRPQAHEIIRTWAYYTLVKAHLHEDTIPWKHVMVSGWCLAADKTKMSKSKGNIITPVHLIEEKGADTVRYWASHSRLGADIVYSEEVFQLAKKCVTKLGNAAKFVGLHLQNHDASKPFTSAAEAINTGIISHSCDRWIISRLHQVIHKATQALEQFEYCMAREAIEQFFWHDWCDNYLELIKRRVYNEEGSDAAGQQSAIHTLYYTLTGLLQLFALYMPHITESLYQRYCAREGESIHRQGGWPKAEEFPYAPQAIEEGMLALLVIEGARRCKSEHQRSMKAELYPMHVMMREPITLSQAWHGELQAVTSTRQITISDTAPADGTLQPYTLSDTVTIWAKPL